MQVPTSSRWTLFVPAKTTTASSFLDTIPDRRLLMPSAVDPGHGKQQAETPVDLSDTSLPWPLTMDAPTILIIPGLDVFFFRVFFMVLFFCFFLATFFFEALVWTGLSLVHSSASTANLLFVSTFNTRSLSFLLWWRKRCICFWFLVMSPRITLTTFFNES